MKQLYSAGISYAIINNMSNKANPFNGMYVEDGFFGIMEYNGGWSFKKVRSQPGNTNAPGYGLVMPSDEDKIIIVVLESPHKDEFDKTTGNSIWPLNNSQYFANYFPGLFGGSNQLQNQGFNPQSGINYYIYFMNANRRQCSLGQNTLTYRDVVFMYYWEKERYAFKKRLCKFCKQHKNVEAIVNCCTHGAHSQYVGFFSNGAQIKINAVTSKQSLNGFFANDVGYNFLCCDKNADSLQDLVEEQIKCCINHVNNKISHTTGTHPSSWRYKKNRKIK